MPFRKTPARPPTKPSRPSTRCPGRELPTRWFPSGPWSTRAWRRSSAPSSETARSHKLRAKELEVPVIAVSQLNRDPERRQDKRPQLSDLRESGQIEQDADVVLLIHRDMDTDNPQARGRADVIIAKHRNGPIGKVELTFLESITSFRDFAPAR